MQGLVQAQFGQGGRFCQALFAMNGNASAAYQSLGINASLPRHTWEQIAQMIIAETQKRLVAVNDVRSRPALLETVPIYVTVYTAPVESDLGRARQAMNVMTTPELTAIDYNHIGIPLPMVFHDTQMDMRLGATPLPGGDTPRTRWVPIATQKVAEEHELNIFNGNTAIASADELGNVRTIYGYTTHPNRNQIAPTAAWATFDVVNDSFQAYISALRDLFFYGPYMVYVSSSVWTILMNRNLSASERTWRDLLLDQPEIADIKFTHDLAAGELIMVDLVPQTITWVQSADIQATDWDAMGIFGSNIRLWSIASPHIKATYNLRSGVVHSTGISAT